MAPTVGGSIISLPHCHNERSCPEFHIGIGRDNVVQAFWADISLGLQSEIILGTDIGTGHMMKHGISLEPIGTANRTDRFVAFTLEFVARHR
jgi:hypothetical protein